MSLSHTALTSRRVSSQVELKPAQRPGSIVRFFARSQTLRIVAVSVCLLIAVKLGALLADAIAADTPWLTLACMIGPILVVSVVFWAIGWGLQANKHKGA